MNGKGVRQDTGVGSLPFGAFPREDNGTEVEGMEERTKKEHLSCIVKHTVIPNI